MFGARSDLSTALTIITVEQTRDPRTGWRIFSLRYALLVYRGVLCLPKYAGQTICIVHADASLVGRKMHKLLWLDLSVLKFESDGRIDREELMRDMQKKIDAEPGQAPEVDSTIPPLTAKDISAIHRCLGLPERGL
jgi:hypothetical protein